MKKYTNTYFSMDCWFIFVIFMYRLCENVPNQRPDRCEFLKPKKVRTKVTTTAPINRRKRSLSFIMPPTMAAFSLGLQQPPAKKKVSSPLPASKSTSKKKTCSRKPTPEKVILC
jgi:hypothetical protein